MMNAAFRQFFAADVVQWTDGPHVGLQGKEKTGGNRDVPCRASTSAPKRGYVVTKES